MLPANEDGYDIRSRAANEALPRARRHFREAGARARQHAARAKPLDRATSARSCSAARRLS